MANGQPMFPPDVTQRQGPAKPELANQWRTWINDPVNRAALIQTGIALLQPMAPGQSPIGHMANSLGQGMAVRGRADEKASAARKEARLAQQQANENAYRMQELQYNQDSLAQRGRIDQGQLAVQQGNLRLSEEELALKKKNGGLTLSEMLANENRVADNKRADDTAWRTWLQKQQEMDAFNFGDEYITRPEYMQEKQQQYLQQPPAPGAATSAPPPPSAAPGVPTTGAGPEAAKIRRSPSGKWIHPEHGELSDYDIAETAAAFGISPQEAMDRLGLAP